MTTNAKDWMLAASVAVGGFAAVRLICWAVCVIFG